MPLTSLRIAKLSVLLALMLPARVHDAEAFAEALREGTERLAVVSAEARLPVSIVTLSVVTNGSITETASKS